MILDGKVTAIIDVGFDFGSTFDVQFASQTSDFDTDVGEVQRVQDSPVYDGPYAVTPAVEAKTLRTARKMMRDDVTVRGIPYYEVSNQFGGNTVYIAKELE